jgi:Tfp pilus assembly protein PilZ
MPVLPSGVSQPPRDPERRTAPRIPQPFLLYYQGRNRTEWNAVSLKDLSAQGARFVRADTFELGEPVKLRLALPRFPEPVSLTGHVVWGRPVFSGRLRMAECGVRFTWIGDEVRRTLEELVRTFPAP